MKRVSQFFILFAAVLLSVAWLSAQQPSELIFMNVRVNDPTQDSREEDHTTQSETTIAVFGDTIVIAYVDTGQFEPRTNGVSSLTGYAISTDRGQTFQDQGRMPPNAIGWGLSDPVLAVDRRGVFYFASNQRNAQGEPLIGVSQSTDGGRTFSRPVLLEATGPASEFFVDKPWIAVDDTEGPFQGHIYLSWTEIVPARLAAPFGVRQRLLFSRSTDGGREFSPAIPLTEVNGNSQIGVALVVGPQGELYAAWPEGLAPNGQLHMKIRRSADGGQTWGPIHTIAQATAAVNPDPQAGRCERSGGSALKGQISSFNLPSLAIDRSQGPNRGRVYVVYEGAVPGKGDNADVFFVVLDSDLNVVIPSKRINDDATRSDQFQPAIAVSPAGIVGVMFYDRRLDEENLKIDVFLAISRDGGITFAPNRRITDVSFDVPPIAGQSTSSRNFDSLRNECYMGDYNGILADNQFLYLVWGDNRNHVATPRYPNGRPDPDVYFSRVPIAP